MNREEGSLFKILQKAIQSGNFIPVIGAGISLAAGVPEKSSILKYLRKITALGSNATSLSELSHYRRRYAIEKLHSFIRQQAPDPPPIYRELSRLPVRLIITTNYDTLIEDALMQAGKKVRIAVTPWDLLEFEPSPIDNVTVVKLHGDLSAPETLVLDRQSESRSELTQSILNNLRTQLSDTVQLFLGFSSNDPILQQIAEAASLVPEASLPRRFIVSKHEQPKAAWHFDKIFRLSDSQLICILNKLAASPISGPYEGADLSRSIIGSLQGYRDFLSRLVHFGWTVDPHRKTDVNKVCFRVCIIGESGKRIPAITAEQSIKSRNQEKQTLDHQLLFEEINKNNRIIITGPAGSGKTTLLQWLTYRLSTSNAPESLFPVFFFSHDFHGMKDLSLRYLLESIAHSTALGGLADGIESLLLKGRVLLILDGIDELPKEAFSKLSRSLRNLVSAFPRAKWIASCRTSGFENFISAEADLAISMCPLNDSEVRCFLDSWFSDTSVAEQLERSINSHENLCELKRLPLFLSLLAELWSHKTSLPISIYQLYEEATDLLLGDWDHQRAVFRQNIYEKPLKRLFLTKWAAACLSRQTLSLSVPAFMKSFSRLATPWSIETTDTYHILTELEQASGLLHHISRGDQWTFSHRSLMDFFAARMLVVAEQHEIEKELRSCKDIKNWIPSLALAISALQQSSEANKLTSIVSQLFSPMAQREIKLLAQKNGNLFSSQSKPTHS